MTDAETERRRVAARKTAEDLARLEARPAGDRFWSSLRLMGSVGWPVALLTLGGAFVGRLTGSAWWTAVGIGLGAAVGLGVALSGAREGGR